MATCRAAGILALVMLALGRPQEIHAASLEFEWDLEVGAVANPLRGIFASGDALKIRFDLRDDAERVGHPGGWVEYPHGLQFIEISLGTFSARSGSGDLLLAPPGADDVPYHLDLRVIDGPRFGHQVESDEVDGFSLSFFWFAAFEIPHSIDPGDPQSLVNLARDRGSVTSKTWMHLGFVHRKTGEERVLVIRQPPPFEIRVPEPAGDIQLSLAALGLAGLWRRVSRRPLKQRLP